MDGVNTQLARKRYQSYDEPFVFRPLEVRRTQQLTPRMIRVTLGGDAVRQMRSLAPDDDIRVQFPEDFDATPLPPVVHFKPFKLVYPDNAPPSQIRAYTIRRLDQTQQELDIDFAIHGDGIATRWAEQARPGQCVTVGGPRGSTFWDGPFDHHVFLGDATALPAIGRHVESLPSGASATVVAEIDDDGEEQQWSVAEGVSLATHWVHRRGALPGRSRMLEEAVRQLPAPSANAMVFAAGESANMRGLRRWIGANWAVDRSRISISGYWKHDDDDEEFFYEEEGDAS